MADLYVSVSEKVNDFIKELNGRYKDHISDGMLYHLLVDRIISLQQERPKQLLVNTAYDAGCYFFESVLEYKCEAGGNGHHVAQDLAKKFV